MSVTIAISATKREELGSAASRRQRKAGLVPAVIYSRGTETITLSINAKDVEKIAHHVGLVKITCDCGAQKDAVVKEIQFRAINDEPLAVDFLEVKPGETVTLPVPVEAVGEAAGIKQGGQLEQVVHTVKINAVPADIPEVLKVDVSGIELDQALTIADIKLASGTIEANPAQIVFHVRTPHVKEAAPEAAAPAAEGEAAAAPAAAADNKEKK